jgi:hypothetical protein
VFFAHAREVNEYRAGLVCLSARLNSRTAGRIFIKFGMGGMLLEATLHCYLQFPAGRTCKVRATLAPHGHTVVCANRCLKNTQLLYNNLKQQHGSCVKQ